MRISIIALASLFTLVMLLFVNQFFFGAYYQFEAPSPFEGPAIYNPYKALDSNKWVKCNFHAHARTWMGITNGHGMARDIHRVYDSLDYGFHAVSDYHRIDTTGIKLANYISAYEHGYNYGKTHQLVLGDNVVRWLDYMFPQNPDNKQYIIEKLHQTAKVVILNHPALRDGYSADELSKLDGYDCIEVLNPSVISTREWDAALSAGKKAFIVGDDDIHNIIARERLGQMCTFVNVPQLKADEAFKSLKAGKSYGVVIGAEQKIDSIPKLESLSVNQDTIDLQMDQPALQITLTGQNGRVLSSYRNTAKIKYLVRPKDHYARATASYKNGTKIFLNPVFFTPRSGYVTIHPIRNLYKTYIFRVLGVIILMAWAWLLWLLYRKTKTGKISRLKNI